VFEECICVFIALEFPALVGRCGSPVLSTKCVTECLNRLIARAIDAPVTGYKPVRLIANIHVHINIYICLYIYIYVYIYIHTHTHIHIHTSPTSPRYIERDLEDSAGFRNVGW
jgi:hypothetical protein